MYPRTAYYIFLSFFRDTIARNLCHSTCSSSSSNSSSATASSLLCIAFASSICSRYFYRASYNNNNNNNNNGHQQHQLSAKSAQRMNFIFILFALHFYDCYANALCKKTRWKLKQKQNQLQSGSATRRGIFCLVGVSTPRPTPRTQQSLPPAS